MDAEVWPTSKKTSRIDAFSVVFDGEGTARAAGQERRAQPSGEGGINLLVVFNYSRCPSPRWSARIELVLVTCIFTLWAMPKYGGGEKKVRRLLDRKKALAAFTVR